MWSTCLVKRINETLYIYIYILLSFRFVFFPTVLFLQSSSLSLSLSLSLTFSLFSLLFFSVSRLSSFHFISFCSSPLFSLLQTCIFRFDQSLEQPTINEKSEKRPDTWKKRILWEPNARHRTFIVWLRVLYITIEINVMFTGKIQAFVNATRITPASYFSNCWKIRLNRSVRGKVTRNVHFLCNFSFYNYALTNHSDYNFSGVLRKIWCTNKECFHLLPDKYMAMSLNSLQHY